MRKLAWTDLDLGDIFYAYRKAKADAFFSRYFSVAEKFAEFELDLPANLTSLLEGIRQGNVGELLSINIGEVRIAAKRLSIKTGSKGTSDSSHGFFSSPSRAFKQLVDTKVLIPEFRIFGDFSVNAQIISALWINMVGHKYDACLSQSAMGSRLRRYHQRSPRLSPDRRDYHIDAIGIYEPYFIPYKLWRKRGLQAIRRELEENHAVAALTLDISNYYHRIDPSFLTDPVYNKRMGVSLNKIEHEFTGHLVGFIQMWNACAAGKMTSLGILEPGSFSHGLPIGLSASPLIANILLAEMDRDIERNLTPLYYGRYVDDIFLVLRDPGNLRSSNALMKYIEHRTECFKPGKEKGSYLINLPDGYQHKSKLVLQSKKQKAFFLEGRGGLDLLDNIDSQIMSVASERRLMPSPRGLDTMASAKILSAASAPSDDADTLRKADGLAVRRLGWAVQLRAAETLARDLQPADWRTERNKFYEFAHNHILRPDRILDHLDYLPRLLSLAVALEDWDNATNLYDSTVKAIYSLRDAAKSGVVLNGNAVSSDNQEIWAELIVTVRLMSKAAILSSIRWDSKSGCARDLPAVALRLCRKADVGKDVEEIQKIAMYIREADFAKVPYKDHLRRNANKQKSYIIGEDNVANEYKYIGELREFIKSSGQADLLVAPRVHEPAASSQAELPSVIPFVFPTRPYSTQEISLFLPEQCVFGAPPAPADRWVRYTQAMRGAWAPRESTSSSLITEAAEVSDTSSTKHSSGTIRAAKPPPDTPSVADLAGPSRNGKVVLGISSLLTTIESWEAAAMGSSDISRQRYERIQILVNQAISSQPKPTYLILPELSLPERWVSTVSTLLQSSGINLIAGLDYQVDGSEIFSAAVLVLSDDRLGYRTAVQIRQVKSLPAPGEEENLLNLFGLSWRKHSSNPKPIYNHGGFSFGVLVCSELQNIRYRAEFQGNIDCLFVLSWNQDLETFSALVESASLDIHAFIALVNNRKYGDSRVRSPAKKHHARDLCRLRGGANEHVVMVELDPDSLRSFQSRAKNWPKEDDPFKPKPEGFVLSKIRRSVPR